MNDSVGFGASPAALLQPCTKTVMEDMLHCPRNDCVLVAWPSDVSDLRNYQYHMGRVGRRDIQELMTTWDLKDKPPDILSQKTEQREESPSLVGTIFKAPGTEGTSVGHSVRSKQLCAFLLTWVFPGFLTLSLDCPLTCV